MIITIIMLIKETSNFDKSVNKTLRFPLKKKPAKVETLCVEHVKPI